MSALATASSPKRTMPNPSTASRTSTSELSALTGPRTSTAIGLPSFLNSQVAGRRRPRVGSGSGSGTGANARWQQSKDRLAGDEHLREDRWPLAHGLPSRATQAAVRNPMNTRISVGAVGNTATPCVPARIPLIVLAAAVIGSALITVLYGPATRERAKHLKTEQIDHRAVCAKLGAPYGSEGFATCVEALDELRRRQADRIAAETAGIL
jgi:hypothetical protein